MCSRSLQSCLTLWDPCGSAGKESAYNAGDLGWEDPLQKGERLSTTVFWPGEFHGLYSPTGHKESDTTEWLSLWDPTDCSPLGSSVHGILQARLLKCTVISSSRESSQPRDQTHISCIAGRFFTTEPQGKCLSHCLRQIIFLSNFE